mmetsp:Transcript_7598/g.15606  ORF Transcript_7598/g.15606 Transcript_7598/m.15606 type:complete len:103 (+) Transcript_7598:548-856(+)
MALSMRENEVTRQQGIGASAAYSKWEENRLVAVTDNKKANSNSGRPVLGCSVGAFFSVAEDAGGGGNARLLISWNLMPAVVAETKKIRKRRQSRRLSRSTPR